MIERFSSPRSPNLYSPLAAFLQFRKLQRDSDATPHYEKEIGELGATGLMALAVIEQNKLDTSAIVSLDQREHQAPDCLIINVVTKTILQKVEVVHYTHYSRHLDIVNFLRETKLAREYRYPEDIHILCHWLGVEPYISWATIHQQLAETAIRNPLSVLVRVDRTLPIYQLVHLAPELSVIEFNLINLLTHQKHTLPTTPTA